MKHFKASNMKKIKFGLITSFVFLFSLKCISQEIKYNELTNVRPDQEFFQSYLSKDGATYHVGDTIHIISPSKENGEFASMTSRVDGDKSITIYPVQSYLTNTNIIIEKIFATAGNALEPSKVIFRFTRKETYEETVKFLYFVNIEEAISIREVKAFGMTSDEALTELKKSKDKLDLGLITQKEYNELKAKLSKYIK